MDMRFRTCNIRSPYRAGSLQTAARKMAKCNLALLAVQKVRWGKGGSQPADEYTFSCGNGNDKYHLVTGFFAHLLFNSALEYAFRKAQENQKG
jgi:hypothetical protein